MPEYKTKKQKQKFYRSKDWRTLRVEALERDNYECQQCKRQGKFSEGKNVHHLKEIYHHPDLALVLDNLETLCIQCHNVEHKRTMDRIKRRSDKKVWNDERW